MFNSVALILFISIIVTALFNVKCGLTLFLGYKILMPINGVMIAGHYLYGNYLALYLFIIFALRYGAKIREWNYTMVIPYALYFGWYMFAAWLGWSPLESLAYIRSDILAITLVPLMVVNFAKFNFNDFTELRKALTLFVAIAVIYGVILIPFKGFNPYTVLMYQVSGREVPVDWLMDSERLFGRITSTFMHAMYYAAFLTFATIYVMFRFKCTGRSGYKILLFFAVVSIVTCGVRSAIMAFMAVMLYYYFKRGAARMFKFISLAMLLVIAIGIIVPQLYEYLLSPFSAGDDALVRGSSIDMRVAQWSAAFEVIRGSMLFGNGYGWSTDYIVNFGNHPTLLAFESQVVKQLCEGGIFGTLLFAFVYYMFFSMKLHDALLKLFIPMMVIAYLVYTILTGDYLYSAYFMIFLSFIYAEKYSHEKY